MAANHTGGKSFQDRELAATVRSMALEKIKVILSRAVVEMNESDKRLHDEVLLKLAGTLLPRLNAGRDDTEQLYPQPIYGGKAE